MARKPWQTLIRTCLARRTLTLLGAILGLNAFALVALQGDGSPGGAPASAAGLESPVASVAIYDSYFQPQVITVAVGSQVLWGNFGDLPHTTTAQGGAWDSGTLAPGDFFSRTFTVTGTFAYYCLFHRAQGMTAVVNVVNADQVPVDVSVAVDRGDDVGAGAVVPYHVSYSNSDEINSAQAAVLTVTLPAATAAFTSTRAGSPYTPTSQSGSRLVYSLGTLAAGDTGTIDLDVQLPNSLRAGDVVSLTASLVAANPDPDTANNYSQDVERLGAANLILSMRPADDSPAFVVGTAITYTLEYANLSSQFAASSVVITDRLPAGVTFVSASRQTESGATTAIAPSNNGGLLTFDLGVVPADGTGRLFLQARLSSDLFAGQQVTNTAGIATASPESSYDDNFAVDVQQVSSDAPDLWVELSSATDGEVGGYQWYLVSFGNRGPTDASNVRLSLAIPLALTAVDFGSTPPATYANGVATWSVGVLSGTTTSDSVYVSAVISTAGQITATASITGSSPEANPLDNIAQVSDAIVPLAKPTIGGPDDAIIGPTPVFFGLGTPEASVSLYLSGTVDVPGRLLGTSAVDEAGRWVISVTTPVTPAGWYWFTATQQLQDRVSPVVGVANFVSTTLGIDPNSITINGERVGGIDQSIEWRRNVTYTLAARLIGCSTPLTPTMQAQFFTDEGLATGYANFAPSRTRPNNAVEFEFRTPEEGQFTLRLNYFCPAVVSQAAAQRMTSRAASQRVRAADFGSFLPNRFNPNCWFGNCPDPSPDKKPPKPPPGCPDCKPIPRPKPKPKPTDPDGFVYDEAKVRAGATITQSIITTARVTATQQVAIGQFRPWNATEFNQVNPQQTDGTYPDKVLIPGYYSFLVPPGQYRIQVTSPGYLPYESPVMEVITTPVTLNVPLKRASGTTRATVATTRNAYLPVVFNQLSGGW